jgi:hypothetical protein
MAKKEKISVEEYVKMGKIKSRRGKPVSPSYLYRLIREHHRKERTSIPFEYVMEGEKDRIYILS